MSFIRTISLGNHEYQPAMGEIKMIPDIKKILYTTDLSETSNFAFSYAAGLANRYDASIVILHVLKDLSHSSEELVTKKSLIKFDSDWKIFANKQDPKCPAVLFW
jgi:hypothetical protein